MKAFAAGALAAALLPACAGSPAKVDLAAPVAAADAPQKPPEEQFTGRSVRLFDDAVAAWEEQKKLRVFDWAVLERKFQAVVEADDRFAEAWFNLGVVYERQLKPNEARKAYRTALDRKPTLKQAAENLAVMLENEGRYADAVAIYQDILRKYPDDGAARARMAALYRDSGDAERAMKFAREALMREPQNLTAQKVMMRTYLDRNNLSMARLVALRAMKLDPSDPELYFTLGVILARENEEAAAIAQFRRALKERDDYLPARLQIADIAVRRRDWANAADQYRKIVQYDPKNAAAHTNLGISYKGLGQYDKAMAEYEAAISLDPSLPAPYFAMGVLFQRHKDAPEKAIENYKKFVTASRDNVPADHPVFENIREAEQYIRQLAEAKAAEERAKAEARAAEERAKKEAEEKKKQEEEQKKLEAEKARAEDAARQAAEKERREKAARETLDAALKKDGSGGKADDAKKGDAPAKPEPKKPKDDSKTERPKKSPKTVHAAVTGKADARPVGTGKQSQRRSDEPVDNL